MRESRYRERDYVFAQQILTMRTRLALTQSEFAQLLGVGRRAVIDWEGGLTYPHVEHLKHVVVLALERKAFSAGREIEEIRALWHAARQKVLLDEAWLGGLLSQEQTPPTFTPEGKTGLTAHASASPSRNELHVDWGDAPDGASFYGREWELDLLSAWVVEERCRVVSVLGQGGIGKSVLVSKVMHRVFEHFEVVIWRSLRDAPTCETLLDDILQVLAPLSPRHSSLSLERRKDFLLECLRSRRVLLIYDNLESLLEEGEDSGRVRTGYESFASVLRGIAEAEHQSSLLLTSRERLSDLVPMEGNGSPVRTLRLARLDTEACQQLLAEKGVAGSPSEETQLIDAYAGNPLALKIVAQTIVDLFEGHIALFLEQGEVVFGDVRTLLDEQYARLSGLEQSLLVWLAILREPVNLKELLAVLGTPLPRAQVLEAIERLHRRSLIEPGKLPGSFMVQSVVMEYVTARLIADVTDEITQSRCSRLITHGLELATCREDVRQTQRRLLVLPILARLRNSYLRRSALEEHLLALLDELREWAEEVQGYGPANLLALLREFYGHLRGLDLSHLFLRNASLQNVEMRDTTLSGAKLQECVFTETFGAIWVVAISSDRQSWAAGNKRGEVWVWTRQTLHQVWQTHTDGILALSFSPDGHSLASGSYDGTVRVWEVESGTQRWLGSHVTHVSGLAYAPDGSVLASGGIDAMVRIWDAQTGTLLETLLHPQAVSALTWSPDGHLLATFCFDRQIRLWQREQSGPATCVACLAGHTNWGMGLAFSPDGSQLASASWDQTIKLWDIASEDVHQTLVGHTDRVQTVAWSPDGRTLASAGFDETIWLWDVERRTCRMALSGHTGAVFSLTFLPESSKLLSGSIDGTIRWWDTERGHCEQILQGYAVSLYDIAWSPDGTQIASSSSNGLVSIWKREDRTPPQLLQGHRSLAFGVEWSPDGRWLASSGWDNALQIWDSTTGARVRTMRDPDDPYTTFYGITWSPDGKLLACGNSRREVQVWEAATGMRRWIARRQPASAWRVAWSPDGTRLVSAGDDGTITVWNATDGRLLKQLPGHAGKVNDVAWSHDGQWLASGGGNREGGELCVWDMRSGERVRVLSGHSGMVSTVAWGSTGEVLVSGDSAGLLRWWDRHSGECLRVCQAHQGTIQRLRLSSDGKCLASCGDDGAIHLWDVEDGDLLRTLQQDRPYERLEISEVKGLTLAQKASLRALGAIENAPMLSIQNTL